MPRLALPPGAAPHERRVFLLSHTAHKSPLHLYSLSTETFHLYHTESVCLGGETVLRTCLPSVTDVCKRQVCTPERPFSPALVSRPHLQPRWSPCSRSVAPSRCVLDTHLLLHKHFPLASMTEFLRFSSLLHRFLHLAGCPLVFHVPAGLNYAFQGLSHSF